MIGQTIGSYRILSQLGEGGMGAVFLAEHRVLGRKAAIKVLQKQFSERADLLERFFAEARATGQIDHPGIVQVLDCDVSPNGQPYIVMEYLGGETLAAVLQRRGRLPPAEAVVIARQAALALAAAHEKGIVHRDVKPDNIFVLPTTPPLVKLVDFGIAKLADSVRGNVGRTQTGVMMGTPLYMSPEQCRGAGTVDHRTDAYSLGVVIFEMLAGRPPFVYEGMGELVAAHLMESPPQVNTLAPETPDDLAALLGDLLKKKAEDRPDTLTVVADRLVALGSSTPPPEPLPLADGRTLTPAPMTPVPVRKADTTLGAASGESGGDEEDIITTNPRRRAWTLGIAGGALAGIAIAVFASRGTGESPLAAGFGSELAPSAPKPVPQVVAAVVSPAPVAAAPIPDRKIATAPARAPHAAAATDRRVSIAITTTPPGAELCLTSDNRLLGRSPLTVQWPADGKRRTVHVRLPGHNPEQLSFKTDQDLRRSVNLRSLGPDDLEAASPCR